MPKSSSASSFSKFGLRLALALRQDSELLARIERAELHPAMAALGLGKDIEEFTGLADVVAANRQNQPARHAQV